MHAPHTKCKKCVTFRACTRSVQFTVTVCLCSLCRVIGRWLFFFFLLFPLFFFIFKVRIINYAYNLHTTYSSRTFFLSLSLSLSPALAHLTCVFLIFCIHYLSLSLSRARVLSFSLFVFCLHFFVCFVFLLFFSYFFPFLEDPIYITPTLSHTKTSVFKRSKIN